MASERTKYQRIQQLPIPDRKGKDAIFNSNYVKDIPAQLRAWNCSKTLLVVSKALDGNTDKVKALEAKLGAQAVGKKAGVGPHSPYYDVIDITNKLHDTNADSIVCVGSSSYSDACKVACLLHSSLPPNPSERDLESLINQEKGITTDSSRLRPPTVKLILVPTSLSASEWNHISSATNSSGKKQHFGLDDGSTAPGLIVLDPSVASTAPERLWLSSGVRAVDHCVETLCSPACNDEVAGLMEQGLRSLLKGLSEYKEAKQKYHHQELFQGISTCQWGGRDAMKGLLLWRIPMGASHAIGHQLGSVPGVMHGVTSCICLAPVLRFTKDKNLEPQRRVVRIFNEALGWSETEAGDAVHKFVAMLGLPTRLEEVGVTDDAAVERIAEKTMTDVWGGGNRQLEYDEVLDILNTVR